MNKKQAHIITIYLPPGTPLTEFLYLLEDELGFEETETFGQSSGLLTRDQDEATIDYAPCETR